MIEHSTPPDCIRVLCVDDSTLLRVSLERCLASERDMHVVPGLPSADLLVPECCRIRPDVVILDLSMQGKRPLDAVRELKLVQASAPRRRDEPTGDTRVIIYSGHNDESLRAQAADAGASGFLCKDADIPTVLRAIRAVARGDGWSTPRQAC